MKKLILIFTTILSVSTSEAQEISSDLSQINIIKVDDRILVCGYLPTEGKTDFKATLYDKKLNTLGAYEKNIPIADAKGFEYQIMYGNTLLVWRGGKPNGYFLKLSKDMKEISFNPKTPENAKQDVVDDQHVLLPNFQMGLEGDPYGAGKGVGVFFTARPNAIVNKRFLGNDILDFDMKTDQVTRYKMNETKLDPSYSPMWKAKLTGNEDIKLTGFTHADEDAIIGCFIVKEDGWKDFVCNIDPKTGNVRFFQEVKFPEADEVFNISNTFYDKEAGKLIVVGQLLLEKRGKDFFNALGVVVFDSNGKMVSSQKIMFPEFEIDEPKGFKFENKKLIAHAIGKLPNGNYFIGCENKAEGAPYTSEYFYSASPVVASAQSTATVGSAVIPYKKDTFFSTIGFSYFELNPSLVVVKSSLKIVETFNKKNNLVTYEGFSNDGKNVVYSELDKERKSFSVIDFNSNDKYGSKELEGDAYDFRLAEKGYKKKDIFFCKVIDDKIVIVRKKSESESFTLTSKSIR